MVVRGFAAGLVDQLFVAGTGALFEATCPTRLAAVGRRASGISVGFLMVVLGRQQLFTESTITVVLPVLSDLSWQNAWRMTRLWAIVLVANLAGTLLPRVVCNLFRRRSRPKKSITACSRSAASCWTWLVADGVSRRGLRLSHRRHGVDDAPAPRARSSG